MVTPLLMMQVLLLGSMSMLFAEHSSPTQPLDTKVVKMRRSKELSVKDLTEAVDEALGAGHGLEMQGLEAIRHDIQPMWRTLTRDKHGRVNRRSFRHVVQKFFMKKHHLSIVGLESNLATDTQTEAALLTDFAPNYVKKVIEGEGARQGFKMEDAVALIAALDRLIEHSGSTQLESVYRHFGLNMNRDVDRAGMSNIMRGYMIHWIMGSMEGAETLMHNATLRDSVIDGWPDLEDCTAGIIKSFEYAQLHNGERSQVHTFNAFRPHFSLADSQAMTGMMARSFGDFWRHQCTYVKDALVKMDTKSNGRVKLSDFHAAALAGEWRFGESKDYLREMGALDESSSWQGPRIMIANYLQAPSNCIISTDHYRVCCANECETLFDELKESIGSAEATPEQIVAAVELMSSGFDDKPEITTSLKSQLKEIARTHAGKVPINGRLFAQWMHYIFPLECIFPHKSGTTTTLSPFEMSREGMLASETELQNHTHATFHNEGPKDIDPEQELLSQWSHEEELLTDMPSSWQIDFFQCLKGLIIMGGVGIFLAKSGLVKTSFAKDVLPTKLKSHYV
jgi:hypothetical protein